jgi:hypothetical protein
MIPVAINDVPVSGINTAAIFYKVPATLIVSILKKENGRNAQARKNKNGTFDYGPFQINSIWLKEIAPYGFTKEDIQYNPCINATVVTWIMAKSLATGKTIWHGVGNYHSRTPIYNQSYSSGIQAWHQKLSIMIL